MRTSESGVVAVVVVVVVEPEKTERSPNNQITKPFGRVFLQANYGMQCQGESFTERSDAGEER